MGTRNAPAEPLPAEGMPNGDAASQNQGTPAAGNDLLAEWPLDVPDMSCIERDWSSSPRRLSMARHPAGSFVSSDLQRSFHPHR